MTNNNKSPKHLLLETVLRHKRHLKADQSLEDWVRARRNGEVGAYSWKSLAEQLTGLTNIPVTEMSLHNWFKDIELLPATDVTGYGINE